MSEISTKPYLLRAIYEWCTDNGYTPHIAAVVDANTRVPREFVKDGEIVLNISFTATNDLKMDNRFISCSARFRGVAREIWIPVENVVAIYANENGQGMAFEPPSLASQSENAMDDHSLTPSVPELTAVPSPNQNAVDYPTAPTHTGDNNSPKKNAKTNLIRIK